MTFSDWLNVTMVVVAVGNFWLIARGVRFPFPPWEYAALNGFVLGVAFAYLLGRA